MGPAAVAVTVGGVVLIAAVNVWFFRRPVAHRGGERRSRAGAEMAADPAAADRSHDAH